MKKGLSLFVFIVFVAICGISKLDINFYKEAIVQTPPEFKLPTTKLSFT